MPKKRHGDRRVSERRKYPSKPVSLVGSVRGGIVKDISNIENQQTGRWEKVYRRYAGQVTTDTRRSGGWPADRRIGPIDRRSGEDRRKKQIGEVFLHKMTGGTELSMIKMSPKEFASSRIPKKRIAGIDPDGTVCIYNYREKKDRRQSKGRHATDK